MTSNNLQIAIARDSDVPLRTQLADQLRQAILAGVLRIGQPMPSSRKLADDLKIARSTVIETYQQLISEGYLQTVAASRTMVSSKLPDVSVVSAAKRKVAGLSFFGQQASTVDTREKRFNPLEIGFYYWRTDFEELPVEQWARVLWRKTRQPENRLLDYAPDRAGARVLREAIAQRVVSRRGIDCTPDQVIILLGFQQAMDLIIRVHIEPSRDTVALEDPCFPEFRKTLEFYKMEIKNISVDSDGIRVDQLAQLSHEAPKLVFVTPSHQFPTGAVLSLPRRLELLRWASEHDSIVVEDDYDSEYDYGPRSIPALKGLDRTDNVVYISTFTKAMYPSIGLGYAIAPPTLAAVYSNARRIASDPVPQQWQEAMADFINEGHMTRHCKRMLALYDEKRRVLISSLRKAFGDRITISGGGSGLHILVRFDLGLEPVEIEKRSASVGVGIMSTQNFYGRMPKKAEFIFGYGGLEVSQIREGIRRLATVLMT